MNRLPSALRCLAKAMALCVAAAIVGCGGSSMPWPYSTQGSEILKQTKRAAELPPSPTYSILYSFKRHKDGFPPYGGLVRDSAGNLYGATPYGGLKTCGYPPTGGVIYKIDSTGRQTVVYAFTGGYSGQNPYGDLLLDSAGNLYGVASGGSGPCNGDGGGGVIFKIAPSGNETALYSFGGPPDGWYPNGGLVMDRAGNLYGTTAQGGVTGGNCQLTGCGVVYKLNVNTRKEAILYSFTGGADGYQPAAGVIRDSAGSLYGTTFLGGSFVEGCCGEGVVFELSGQHEMVLHTFNAPYGGDGKYPVGGLLRDHQGNLFGTTEGGGNSGSTGWGTAFRLAADGKETILHDFTGGADGGEPRATLVMDPAGNLYGTTYGGGAGCHVYFTCGVVFELNRKGRETVLHTFDGNDGGWTSADVLRDAAGNLYGTTPQAGPYADGVAFKISVTRPQSR